MVDISMSILSIWFINQLITGGHHLVTNKIVDLTNDLFGDTGKIAQEL